MENTFHYTYSASENQEVLTIRNNYLPQQENPLDTLKKLDARVRRPAGTFAYTYGSVGAIVMGCGMSLVMTEIGTILGLTSTLIPGIVIGVAGLGMVLSTYPIYKRIFNSRKEKYAPQIIELSAKILEG